MRKSCPKTLARYRQLSDKVLKISIMALGHETTLMPKQSYQGLSTRRLRTPKAPTYARRSNVPIWRAPSYVRRLYTSGV